MSQTPKNGKSHGNAPPSAMPQDEIGTRLRAMYAEVESEAIPARLIDLLDQLDAAEKQGRE